MNILTNLIPWPYRVAALLVLAVALVGFGWVKGAANVQGEWDAANAKQAERVSAIKKRQAEATVKVVTRYIDRIQVVRDTGDAITKEVPFYVTTQDDAACQLTRGFVRLHDAAAAGRVPGAAGVADAAPAGIALSSAAATVADNYERCRENASQLNSLQEWIRAQAEASQ
jgi:hypothetical protein